ncbi:MAG: hypothetical protein JO307_02880 [Bryobacterales bacterium]|nr:hypothetical protein [Bryobacterales bacterium]MBV9398510.1 hypothetical protein [Bryobacterales bacterium]
MRFTVELPDELFQASSLTRAPGAALSSGVASGGLSGGEAPGSGGGGVAMNLTGNAFSAGAAEQFSAGATSGDAANGAPANDGGAAR